MYLALKANLEKPTGRQPFRIYDPSRCGDQNLYNQYESFFKFAIGNRRESWNDCVSDPFYLYFIEYNPEDDLAPTNEAYARRQTDGTNVIGIGNILFQQLYVKCRDAYSKFTQVVKLHRVDVDGAFTVPIDYYSFLLARHFLFYHELAHLMQGDAQEHVLAFENYILGGSIKYDERSHIRELDADLVGCNNAIDHVLRHFASLPKYLQTQKNGEDLVALAVIGVFFLFDLLSNGLQSKIFHRHGTHPHPAIRVRSILETMSEKFVQVQKWPPWRAFEITKRFLEMLSYVVPEKTYDRYVRMMVSNSAETQEYRSYLFRKMMSDESLAWKKIKDKAGEVPPIRF